MPIRPAKERRFYVGDKIKELRQRREITQLDIAKSVDRRPETIWRWEGGAGIKSSDCRNLAKVLGVSFEELISADRISEPSAPYQADLPPGAEPLPTSYVKIPRLGTCPASEKAFADDRVLGWEWVPRDAVRGQRAYLLRIKGDSMNQAGIDPDDTVLVYADQQPENGSIVVALIDGECTIKRYYRQDHQIQLVPDSTNPKHQPQVFTRRNEVMLRGVVREVWRKRVR